MALSVSCSTWNVHMLHPKDDNLFPWLQLQDDNEEHDIHVIGLQEVPYYPQSLVLDYYIRNDPWTNRISLFLAAKDVVVVETMRMMGLLLIIGVHKKHLPYVKERRKDFVRTALWGILGVKGAVGIRLTIHNETFCFLNAHFTAGDEYQIYRNSSYKQVLSKMWFPNCETNSIIDHRYIFFLGDFNYRIDNIAREDVISLINMKEFDKLLENDQMLTNQKSGECFAGFSEAPITFAPTYKFSVGSNQYDSRMGTWLFFNSVKMRKPAWCDRIVWKVKDSDETVTSILYTSHMDYTTSDHKPVSGRYNIELPACKDAKPTIEFRFDPSYIPWTTEEDGVCVFHAHNYKTSNWDWIGLYRMQFTSPKDYFTYEWSMTDADSTGQDGCMVLFDDVPEEPGFYQLGYYSKALDCMLGFSEPFEVILQPDEPEGVTCEVPPSDLEQV